MTNRLAHWMVPRDGAWHTFGPYNSFEEADKNRNALMSQGFGPQGSDDCEVKLLKTKHRDQDLYIVKARDKRAAEAA